MSRIFTFRYRPSSRIDFDNKGLSSFQKTYLDCSFLILCHTCWFLQQVLCRASCELGKQLACGRVVCNLLVSSPLPFLWQQKTIDHCHNCPDCNVSDRVFAVVATPPFRVDKGVLHRSNHFGNRFYLGRFPLLFYWSRCWMGLVKAIEEYKQSAWLVISVILILMLYSRVFGLLTVFMIKLPWYLSEINY